MYWLLAIPAVLVTVLGTCYYCYRRVFYSAPRVSGGEASLPEGEEYDPYRERIAEWIRTVRGMEHREVEIRSFDGLRLVGKYFEYEQGAPIEILFHGYRGTAERDTAGGVLRCFAVGHNVLLVEQRASGNSEGSVITFGINERRDCLCWIDFVLREIDPDAEIILSGVSMGAATVMMAAGQPLPPEVIAVLADCGYTSPKEIIKKVVRDMRLPPALVYPFIRLGALIFGHFDPEEDSPVEAVGRASVPIIFFHGDADGFVPYEMSLSNFAACSSEKKMVTVEGAAHGLAYPRNEEKYIAEASAFFAPLERKNRENNN